MRMWRLLRRLAVDESGQEIVEYALLAGFIALATLPVLAAMLTALRAAYVNSNETMFRCWQMPEPGAGAGC